MKKLIPDVYLDKTFFLGHSPPDFVGDCGWPLPLGEAGNLF